MKKRADHEGTIFQRSSDKRWVVQFTIPDKQKRISKYAKSEKEAVQKLHELITKYNTGTYVDPNAITLRKWLDQWMPIYVEDNVSPNTYARKLDLIRIHINPGIGDIQLQKLIPTDIQLFYKKLLKKGKKTTIKDEDGNKKAVVSGLAPQTVKHIHNILKPALRQAVEDGILAKSPMDKIKTPKVKRTKEIKVLSEIEIGKYLEALKAHRLYTAFVLDLCTGMRRGELLGLKWSDITELDEVVTITIKRQIQRVQNNETSGSSLEYTSPKTEGSNRTLVLPICAVTELNKHKARQRSEKELAGKAYQDEGLIFCTVLGKKLDTRRLYELHCRALKRAEIDHLPFHNLRHTVATLLLEKGENIKTIQELLGHADISTTLNTYSHVTNRTKAASALKLNSLIGNVMPAVNSQSVETMY